MKKILVTVPCDESYKQLLCETAPDFEMEFAERSKVTKIQVQSADIILGSVPAGHIEGSERLEWLQLVSSGADPYVKPGVLAERTILTSSTGAYGKAVSEHLFAVTLALIKKLHLYRDCQHTHDWANLGTVTSLSDATVLVVGTGDIGLHYARLCKLFGAKVIGVRRRESEKPECIDEIYLTSELDKVLPLADVVASFLPGSADTKGIFSFERLFSMKRTAVFINGGRGNVISCDELYRALSEGIIAGAGLDVFETEPLPETHPLWDEPNILITPHVAGGDHLDETFENVRSIVLENLRSYLKGRALKSVIDRSSGYSK